MSGPLHGLRVVEMGGLGPAPFAGMLLADLGAEVVRVDRPVRRSPADAAADPVGADPTTDLLNRGRRMLVVDVKAEAGRAVIHDLVSRSDVLIEGFRPGVMERLGLGPDALLAINPKLIFGRMTGWGQEGPLAQAAGHDINYIALAGVLEHIGTVDDPIPPLNLVGDFGGGGMLLALGVLAALFDRQHSGQGQVVDASMVDGAALMMASYWGMLAAGTFDPSRRQSNVLDGGAPFYGVYRCRDGRHISIAAAEPQFWAELVDRLGVDLGVDPVSRLDPRVAGTTQTARGGVRRTDPRRLVSAARGHRRLLRTGPDDGRGCRPPSQRGSRGVHRGGRRAPARNGAAVRSEHPRYTGAARAAGNAQPSGAVRAGAQRRGDR